MIVRGSVMVLRQTLVRLRFLLWDQRVGNPEPAVEVDGLIRRFGSFTAVDGVSFAVETGELFGFLGPNGAGKTTTISILCTLLRPTAGTARVAGCDVAQDPAAVRRRIALVFQDPSLDDQLTARENLELHGRIYGVPAPARKQPIDALLGVVRLSDR